MQQKPLSQEDKSSALTNTLLTSFAITVCFVVIETYSGIRSHSLALISDAGHNFADALALLLAYGAAKVAESPSSSLRTFGYHRATILAALINALSLVMIALVIFYEAYQRMGEARIVDGKIMIVVALAALLMNGVIAMRLRKDTHDLNVRSAFMHMLGDAISAIAVVIAGVIILLTDAYWVDPLISIIVGVFILWSSWGVIREATNILMEYVPIGLDMKGLEKFIKDTQGVIAVHDLHVWTISSGRLACSCHVTVSNQTIRDGQQVIKEIIKGLKMEYDIGHTTIQIEIEGCDPDEIYCNISTPISKQHVH